MQHKSKQFLPVVSPPELPQVTKDLEAAKKLLRRGWCQEVGEKKWLFGLHTQHCIVGALYTSAERFYGDRYEDGLAVVQRVLGTSSGEGIAYWNDKSGRTKSEVLALMDRAIIASVIGG